MAAIDYNKKYTADEFFEIIGETNERFELLNGEIVCQAAPNTRHQSISGNVYFDLKSFIKGKNGKCRTFIAPYDVKLDENNTVQPDVMIVCDSDKIDDNRCNGAPDFVVEVVSSDRTADYNKKLDIYKRFGVKEYWIIDPTEERVLVYIFDDKKCVDIHIYTFEQDIPVNIFNGELKIKVNDM